MAQIEQSDSGGKKKKGAQKKVAIHVDFTPMVDMNMLLITFFMLCTTMIKSQTLPINLPSNSNEVRDENRTQVDKKSAITLILDTETDEQGKPLVDDEGRTKHHVYYYFGEAQGTPEFLAENPNFLKDEQFSGNDAEHQATGIRKILAERNKDVLTKYNQYKQDWRDKKITKEEFDSLAKENRTDSTITSKPTVLIKPGPNSTYEALINAIDEMQINQISTYNIEHPNKVDSLLILTYKAAHGIK